ncbi:MAG: DUF2461 domain-containing protein [Rhodospirillaceae bacterium]|nr:DUF2461 domain-containing protein [Rhodospirillales bacterium]
MMEIEGLSPALPAFLAELAANNERAWFADHKSEYADSVQAPLRNLVAALAPAMLDIDPGFDTNPKGAAVSRIHRDTRFSRDKSPYRINQWICFKRAGEGWQGRPAFFLEIGPSGYRYGMGYYAAPPATMKAVRAAILACSAPFAAAMEPALAAGFALEGEPYSRPSLPEGEPQVVLDWVRRKSAYLVRNRLLEPLLFSPDLVEDLATRWRAVAPLYQYLGRV